MKTIEIVVIILLFILSILMIISGWDNHGKSKYYEYPKEIRKISKKDIRKIICNRKINDL